MQSSLHRRVWISGVAVVLGCATGGCVSLPGGMFHPWNGPGPAGLTVELTTRQETLRGELLAVGESGLLVLDHGPGGPAVTHIDFRAIRSGKVHQSRLRFRPDRLPTPDEREQLRLVSRYPQGVADDLLQRLLDAYGQTEPHAVTAAGGATGASPIS